MRILITALAVLLLSGCQLQATRQPMPVDEGCDAACRTACDATVPLWAPDDPDAPNAWDSYPEQVTVPLRGKILQCDIQRQTCVQCLDRLKAAGVTR